MKKYRAFQSKAQKVSHFWRQKKPGILKFKICIVLVLCLISNFYISFISSKLGLYRVRSKPRLTQDGLTSYFLDLLFYYFQGQKNVESVFTIEQNDWIFYDTI